MFRFFRQRSLQVIFSTASLFLCSLPAQAAETVYVSLGLLEISVSLESLEQYAEDGTITQELAAYTRYLSEEQKEKLQEILTIPAELDTIAIAQFLYSPQGEAVLRQFGEIVDTKARQGGFYAIRSALILAAADPEGLTLLNFLQHFPTDGLRINSGRGLELVNQLSKFIKQTDRTVALIEQQALEQSIETAGTKGNSFPRNLQSQGTVPYTRQTLDLVDRQRDSLEEEVTRFITRQIPTNLYLPQTATFKRPPLIIISHGLGSDRSTYTYLAEHLASYGFAVATIEHPGSNARQLQSLLMGLKNEVSPPSELINRPKDIKFLLNYLERNYNTRINLNQVGILGQSYGAYTSLALAGANIKYAQVAQQCQTQETATVLNFSVLLQCQLLRLPRKDYNFDDSRIKAVFAINPLTSIIFGQDGLQKIEVPTLLVTGSADTVTPALAEQIRPFTWLETSEKYLVLLKRGTHFSTLAEGTEEGIPVPKEAIGPDPAIAQDYIRALSTAFFKTYLAKELDYQPYLSAEYTDEISRYPMPLFLLNSLPEEFIGDPED
ncbi:MAG: alpha/beta hydrolase [Halothece sp. Uz-M2-17]|nr:alpha/beta hydrolase [Halothece sp. Uz-M2-17]